jgi:hypothetical protein
MPDSAKKPCRICRKWFHPDVRVGKRQRTCGRTECQQALKKKRLAKWRARNPDYFIARRIQERSKTERTPEPLRLPPPLSNLPWDIAQDEFGVKGADFIGVMSSVMLRAAKTQISREVIDSARDPAGLPPSVAKTQFRGQVVDST